VTTPALPRHADPGLIGLLGFVMATVIAQLAHLGILEQSPVFWIGAVFGGVVQVIAGMLSWADGDDFHFLVYNAFGWYWIVQPGFLLGEQLQIFAVSDGARGTFAISFAVLAAVFAVAGAAHNSVLPFTLLCVALGLGLQGIALFAGASALSAAGSVVLLVASAAAAYMGIEKFYWRTLGRRVLPLGPAWVGGAARGQ
jgi:succinate-acetate transporter protein